MASRRAATAACGSLAVVLLLSLGLSQRSGAAPMKDLSPLAWKHRVILVKASETTRDVAAVLRAADARLAERDVVWFVLDGERVESNFAQPVSDALRRHLHERFARAEGARVLLLGKDGGVKAREKALDLDRLLALIDSMPMRQQKARPASDGGR
jgi:hypothetical protein